MSYGVLEIMISAAIMFGGVLAILKRYRLLPGSFILVFGTVGILLTALHALAWPWEVLGMIVIGGVIDVMDSSLDPNPEVPNRFRMFGLVAPAVAWSTLMTVPPSAAGA